MLPNGVKFEDLSPIGRLWVQAIMAQEAADKKIHTGRDAVLIYAYIKFPGTNRLGSGENSLVLAYHQILRGLVPSEIQQAAWFERLRYCWSPGLRYPDSLNVAFDDHRGEHIDEVLNGLRQAIPEQTEVHQFQLAADETTPAGNDVRHEPRVAPPTNVVDLARYKQAQVA